MINKEKERISINPSLEKTNTTTFLLPGLELDKEIISSNGFINAYLNDDNHNYYQNSLYLLFKPNEGNAFEELINYIESKHKIIEIYDIDKGYTVLIVKFPSKYLKEYKHFKVGHYSKFSKTYITTYFPFEKTIEWDSKGKPSKKEFTLYYHIFNKTDWLRDWWAKRLGYEDPKEFESDELWAIPDESKEVLRFNIK